MSLKQNINFSLWCDFIQRDFLENGFKELINQEIIYGATSNPTIFQNAIVNSTAYEQQINMLQANESKKIYEELAIVDIKKAAELLKSLHDSNDNDGFISLEVDPHLCNNTSSTFEEGKRLYNQIAHENVMIKVPATQSGYLAMKQLTSLGIPVNATLVFSPHQAMQCAKALNEGILESKRDTKAVISIFVSRFDRLLDEQCSIYNLELSQIGIINATKCYHCIEKFENKNIRALFASTGVKNDLLKDTYYIDNLLFPNTINTAPLNTIEAWKTSGSREPSSILTSLECDKFFNNIKNKGIDMKNVYNSLLKDGLSVFKISFEELLTKVKL
jgi:transaldolase